MESISLKHLISAADTKFPVRYSANPVRIRKIGPHIRPSRLILYSKKWDFQDFQGYAKPTQLLPASEVNICTHSSLEQMIDFLKQQKYESLYKVKLQTSSIYGSILTDPTSRVLLCLIDEHNYSILQRIPACLPKDNSSQLEENEVLHFQRGCVDEFIFGGPSLGSIAAIWISLESGQWRLGHVSLAVICPHQSPSTETDNEHMQFTGAQYDFDLEDILLGEGSDFLMTEIRPHSVTKFSGEDFSWLNLKPLHSSSLGSYSMSSEESMMEYADLKFSLLIYDAIFVLAGSSIASFLGGENVALAFFVGGIGGFLYLLLLQRSVDGLPAPELVSTNKTENLNRIFGKFKGSLSSLILAFAFAFAVIATKYISGDAARVLTPSDLIFGMSGFLMCKIAVILAAFRPMPAGTRENK